MRRWYWGFRDRLTIIPKVVWINFSRAGASLSIHFWLATWNSRRGWHFHGPFGLYVQERRRRSAQDAPRRR